MRANLKLNRYAATTRSALRSVAILAGVPLIVTVAFCAPALAACGVSHPAGVHAVATGASGVHVATTHAATSAASGGGGGTLGCPSGSSAAALRGLPVATSGRVMQTGSHTAHAAANSRNAVTKTTNATAHLRGVKSPHHA